MLWFRDASIRVKMMVVIMVPGAFAVALVTLAYSLYATRMFSDHLDVELRDITRLVAIYSAPALDFRDEEVASEVLAPLKDDPRIARAAIHDVNNNIFAAVGAETPRAQGLGVMRYEAPILRNDGEMVGRVLVHADISRILRQHYRDLFMLGLSILAAASVATFVMSR